ncbi:phosphodiesterase [Acetivibrio ethanolgignens]|uniref:Phosphoesterase n=1 Tax=Acetivibrio ethanolgignens TaxID=290052 RepID=A0A0V8QH32_9FIRM|nr:phosphodiesterase [Acetivibrio ethanolgignens]KSV59401.1 phosphodiesterase [Acetivibrio ethanolgignens]
MKLMIASDIHGSAYYCRKMLEAFDREQPEKLILLGDILYHGPRNDLPKEYAPKEVIGLLNERKESLLCVRGNCEAEVDQMVLDFPVLAEYMILYLDGRMVFATHGHIHNEEKLPPLGKNAILLHGHTHIPVIADRGDYLFLNPGSVSIPKGESKNSYMVYENGSFCIKELMTGEVLLFQ